ncbi:MAG: flavodoxin domain-containing protein [Ruminococcus sp.]
MKAAVIYWSGTGNTEQMAQAIADAAGAELFAVSDFSGSIADYDRIAFGCSAMGDEVLEEDEFEPFFASIEGDLSGRPSHCLALWWATANDAQLGRDAKNDGATLLAAV